jgi:alpha-glucosidase
MLIDAGWSQGKDITKMNGKVDIPEVVKYAAPKNVKIWIWAHYDSMMAHMDEALPLFEKWGVVGTKIDFVERDDQEGIDFYYRVAKKAADHHLMLDFHGCTKPSGISRTWPNIMSYEAVLGMEHSKAGARDNPEHHVTLPFTRMLAGPIDYTPGGFDNVTRDEFVPRMDHPMVMGTRAHHLAMYAIYEAAFQMVSDCPQNYEGQPAFDFVKAVPAAWDETRVSSGKVGQYIVMARRKGDNWFIGAMTGGYPRTLEIPLTFLGDGKYTAETYADARDSDHQPKHVEIESQTVDRSTTLKPHLVTAGGFAARLHPEK